MYEYQNSYQNSPRFEGQVSLVVGGARGIGRAIAARLAQEQSRVVIADINGPLLQATVREMQGEGVEAQSIQCDVRHSADISSMVAQTLAWHGRIDVLMYVAGIAPLVPFLETSEATWDDTLDINLRGAFLTAKAVAPSMISQKHGKLVFMASTNSWEGEPGLAHYNASKAGLFLLAKTLARELGPYGINSNAIGPGFIRTPLTEPILRDPEFTKKYDPAGGLIPLGRLGTPEDVTGPALFLASPDAAYVNGVLLFVDGGQMA